ncbi:MAG: ABC transporter permease, partial [Gammaproteobacteria bacterium]
MFNSYLLAAWRHIVKNQLSSIINVFGLSVGLMSCILILLYVRDELSYDKWMVEGNRVVRMHTAYLSPDRPPFLTIRSAGRMMEAIRDYSPQQVESGVRLLQVGVTMRKEANLFNESVLFADQPFFDLFELPFLHGSPDTSFNKPSDLVVTEEMALKYFGRNDVVGESLTVCCLQGSQFDVQVTGVIKNLPENTHLDIDFLSYLEPSLFDFAPNLLNTWTSVNTYTYFKLNPGATPEDLKERIDYWLDNESPLKEMVPEDVIPSEMLKLKIMAVPDIHLYAQTDAGNLGDMKALGDINMVYTFTAVAILILLIASINFMNLSTARASKRAREVALRKVMGASRLQIAMQFLGEAVAITIFALFCALVAVELTLPLYNNVIGRELRFDIIEDLPLLLSVLMVAVWVGLLSGSYPAVYLSRFLPVRILQGSPTGESGGQGSIRALLVVFQFAASIGLAVCTLVIFGQTQYARNMDVGYSYDSKLVLSGLGSAGALDQHDALINELSAIAGVKSVVLSSEVPSQDNENNTGFQLLDGANEGLSDAVIINYYTVGFGFFEAYGMKILAGRFFDEQFGTDEVQSIPDDEERIGNASIVVNESAMRALGFSSPEEVVGKTLRAGIFGSGTHDLKIIGVSKDVYFRSIKFGIRPSVFFNDPRSLRVATISFDTNDIQGLVSDVERVWKEMVPMYPVNHQFLMDMIRTQYQTEENQAKLLAVFAILAVVIACLGLYGLASFT